MGNRSGFTLIECMVIFVIVGILAALVIPKFQRVVKASQHEAGAVAVTDYAVPTAESYICSNRVSVNGGTSFVLEKGDSSVLIDNSLLGTPNNSIRKVTITEYGERTEWVLYEKRFRDTHYRRGVNAYYVYTSYGMPIGYFRP